MQTTLILCAAALTVTIMAFLIVALRAVNQATQTLQKLEQTLSHANETLNTASEVLEGLDERFQRLDPAINRLVDLGNLAGTVTSVVSRGTRGPISFGTSLALAAVEGFRAFRAKRSNSSREADVHE